MCGVLSSSTIPFITLVAMPPAPYRSGITAGRCARPPGRFVPPASRRTTAAREEDEKPAGVCHERSRAFTSRANEESTTPKTNTPRPKRGVTIKTTRCDKGIMPTLPFTSSGFRVRGADDWCDLPGVELFCSFRGEKEECSTHHDCDPRDHRDENSPSRQRVS